MTWVLSFPRAYHIFWSGFARLGQDHEILRPNIKNKDLKLTDKFGTLANLAFHRDRASMSEHNVFHKS